LTDIIERNAGAGRLSFTTNKDEAYRDAQAIFICVGTPADEDGSADVRHVLAVAKDIGEQIEKLGSKAAAKLVVVKSTVPVGTSHRVRDVIRSITNNNFYIANNPEFLKEGAAIADFTKPDRVICGVDDEAAGNMMRDLYEPFVRQGNPIFIMDVRSSEMVKYASNAMLACKISFINEMANLCERYGADIHHVREGMCADHRIGKQFLYPGLGYGGSCFPKDTLAVVNMGKVAGMDCMLNAAVHQVNQNQRGHFWSKIERHFGGNVKGRTLAFWGIAFKPETDDIREAPSVTLIRCALKSGAKVQAYDPVAATKLNESLPEVKTHAKMYDALDGCDALIVCTEWSEFRHPDFQQMASRMKQKTIFDGRNIFRRRQMEELKFTYYSVGRLPVNPATR
jgi:UDPglucose 6-dehydrogenase